MRRAAPTIVLAAAATACRVGTGGVGGLRATAVGCARQGQAIAIVARDG